MQQSSQTLNPWLVSYIEQHRNNQSRYQIDKYLIEAGYDAGEIEFAWQAVMQSTKLSKVQQRKSLPSWAYLLSIGVFLIYVLPAFFPKTGFSLLKVLWPLTLILPTFALIKYWSRVKHSQRLLWAIVILGLWIFTIVSLLSLF